MSQLHDIYDPPPAPRPLRPARDRLNFSAGDVAFLAAVCGALFVAAYLFWTAEPAMALLTAVGGSLVILESWVTALSFLQRHSVSLRARLTIFVAALAPWVVGLAVAALLMSGLFYVSDLIIG